MGRPSMSEEEIANNKISIIRAAMDMIHESGISSVTARALGDRVGMNSALIYRYFKDIDEVILFGCVHALQDYTKAMTEVFSAADMTPTDTYNEDIYITSWELFGSHAFAKPDEYMTLFFSKHSENLESVIAHYYELLPRALGPKSNTAFEVMYRTANLRQRNLIVLHPVLEDRKTDHEIELLNDITIAFFHGLLMHLISKEDGITPEGQLERMLECVDLTLR